MKGSAPDAPCPRCGKARAEWTDGDGRGFEHGGETYCSRRCAEVDERPDAIPADRRPPEAEPAAIARATRDIVIRPHGYLGRWWSRYWWLVLVVAGVLTFVLVFARGAPWTTPLLLGLIGAVAVVTAVFVVVFDRVASLRVAGAQVLFRGLVSRTSFPAARAARAVVLDVWYQGYGRSPGGSQQLFLVVDAQDRRLLKLSHLIWDEADLESFCKALGIELEQSAGLISSAKVNSRFPDTLPGWQRRPWRTGLLIGIPLVALLLAMGLFVIPLGQSLGLFPADRLDLTVTGGASLHLSQVPTETEHCVSNPGGLASYSVNMLSGGPAPQWRFEAYSFQFTGPGTYQLTSSKAFEVFLIGPGPSLEWDDRGQGAAGVVVIHADNSGSIDADLVSKGGSQSPVHVTGSWSCVFWGK